ncbi:predicted protein [Postia placenta Mad-698-R]|uniref:Uncharacterized protein n=1 Tax=Postia placenta MAD-698-R-SB12 TaxID=670580 RepID=A0A1X6MKL7_9APHY|nr:hypothetical protein POSPLADRAFT_1157961 [Postia placenta MAD-698-R-SB12]EED84616.1 predicted protein [Postia placenta Mad-698-R]OSX56905.1 hypothetical protein POSPLADRAFT_1157961 [Postia placenta MAD-698-R-SB12]
MRHTCSAAHDKQMGVLQTFYCTLVHYMTTIHGTGSGSIVEHRLRYTQQCERGQYGTRTMEGVLAAAGRRANGEPGARGAQGALFFSRAQWMRVYQARVERASRMREQRECGSHAQRKQSWINYAPVREKRTPVSVRERVCIGEESGPAFSVCCGGCMEGARERQQLDHIHTRNELREDCSEEGVVAEGAAWSMGGRCIEDVTTE